VPPAACSIGGGGGGGDARAPPSSPPSSITSADCRTTRQGAARQPGVSYKYDTRAATGWKITQRTPQHAELGTCCCTGRCGQSASNSCITAHPLGWCQRPASAAAASWPACCCCCCCGARCCQPAGGCPPGCLSHCRWGQCRLICSNLVLRQYGLLAPAGQQLEHAMLLRGGQRLSQRLEHGWQQRRETLRCSTPHQDASRNCVSIHVPGRALPSIFSCCCHSCCACAAF
jgi:hypothetical protein